MSPARNSGSLDYSLKVLSTMAAQAGLVSRRVKRPIGRSTLHGLLRNPTIEDAIDLEHELPAESCGAKPPVKLER
jgi:hypothetical protein